MRTAEPDLLDIPGADIRPLASPREVTAQHWPADATPMVSVCCATYNHERYLGQALDGFLMQRTRFPVEIIVHDDASTDATPEILRAYAERHPGLVRPVFQTENQYSRGVSPMATCIRPRARGRYVASCEGDDYWTDPLQLQKQVDFLETHPDYVMCFANARVLQADGSMKPDLLIPPSLARDLSAEELMLGGWTPTLARCARNIPIQLPEGYHKVLNQDIFWTVLLGRHGKAGYLADIEPPVYRRHAGGVWTSLAEEEKRLQQFNSFATIYLYLWHEAGRDIAQRYLLTQLLPLAGRICPDENPLARERARLRTQLQELRQSLTHRVAGALVRPLQWLQSALRPAGEGVG